MKRTFLGHPTFCETLGKHQVTSVPPAAGTDKAQDHQVLHIWSFRLDLSYKVQPGLHRMKYLTCFPKTPLAQDKAMFICPAWLAHTTTSSHCCEETLGILVCESLRSIGMKGAI